MNAPSESATVASGSRSGTTTLASPLELPRPVRNERGEGLLSFACNGWQRLNLFSLLLAPFQATSETRSSHPHRYRLVSLGTTGAALLLCLLTLLPSARAAATNDLTALLQQGLFAEQANRDLDAAIANYQTLARQFDKDRQLAATATFRLGECYRAQGKSSEAAAQYQRLIRDFADQKTLVTLSQQNLAGMGNYQAPPATAATTDALATVEANAALLKAQLAQLDQLKPEDKPVFVQQNFPNPVLNQLMADYLAAQQKRIVLLKDYTPESPVSERAKALEDKIRAQMDDQIAGVKTGLEIKLQAALAQVKTLQTELPPASPTANAARAQQKDLLTKQIALAEQDLAETKKKIGVTQVNVRAAESQVLRLRQELAALEYIKPDLVNSPPPNSEEDQEIARIQAMIQNSPDLINSAPVNGTTPLIQAAGAGQFKVVTFLLDHGADINLSPGDNGLALLAAAGAGNRAMAEMLLRRGADVNGRNNLGETALSLATKNGFQAVAEVLIANKANLDLLDNSRQTPLHYAVNSRKSALVALLISNHANLDIQNNSGQTALSMAAKRGQSEIVSLLLAAGAKPDIESNVGKTALSYAATAGSLESVKCLLAAKANPNAGRNDSPLYAAMVPANVEIVKLLLEHGADPNFVYDTKSKETLLILAASKQPEIIKLLLQYKADPNLKNAEGNTALLFAIWQHSLPMVQALLASGADPNQAVSEGIPPLICAIENDANRDIAAALIAAKADVNGTNRMGDTPLHIAALVNNLAMAELLIKARAEVNCRNTNGITPLDYAKRNAESQESKANNVKSQAASLVDYLRQHGALDDLPDFTRIRITRQGLDKPYEVFLQATPVTNQFMLLETVMRFYSRAQVDLSPRRNFSRDLGTIPTLKRPAWEALPFPDFGRILIHRPSQKLGGKEQEIKVSLLNSSNVMDCALDVPLVFGDVIEIPEQVHALNASAPNPVQAMEATMPGALDNFALTFSTGQPLTQGTIILNTPNSIDNTLNSINTYRTIIKCLQKPVKLVVGGKETPLLVNSWKEGFLSQALDKIEARSALRSSSDLTRIKVTRQSGSAGHPEIIIVDASHNASGGEFWLRTGDVIEVPEKP